MITEKERIRKYRRYVYEAGAIHRPVRIQTKLINDRMVAKERKNYRGNLVWWLFLNYLYIYGRYILE